ncbi:hypothetical protein GCM10007159_12570 [Modicisalibacter luteus]|nr:hypothetical protein GCM10007159_12570 [Halomonas lutea]
MFGHDAPLYLLRVARWRGDGVKCVKGSRRWLPWMVGSDQVVLLEFLAQRAAIEAQHVGSAGLVAAGMCHHGTE